MAGRNERSERPIHSDDPPASCSKEAVERAHPPQTAFHTRTLSRAGNAHCGDGLFVLRHVAPPSETRQSLAWIHSSEGFMLASAHANPHPPDAGSGNVFKLDGRVAARPLVVRVPLSTEPYKLRNHPRSSISHGHAHSDRRHERASSGRNDDDWIFRMSGRVGGPASGPSSNPVTLILADAVPSPGAGERGDPTLKHHDGRSRASRVEPTAEHSDETLGLELLSDGRLSVAAPSRLRKRFHPVYLPHAGLATLWRRDRETVNELASVGRAVDDVPVRSHCASLPRHEQRCPKQG